MNGKTFGKSLILGVFLLAAAGCAGEAVTFNNAIVNYNKRLNEAGKKFGEALAPALQGGAVNVAQVKATYAEVESTLEQVKKDFAALHVPKSASGQKLAKSYEKFLAGQESAVKNQMAQLVKLVEAPGRPNAGMLMSVLQEVGRREQGDLAELQNAQREFARENNIKLQNAP
jgi:hypothetical protein